VVAGLEVRHDERLVRLHWLMAGALVAMVLLGLTLTSLSLTHPARPWLTGLHVGLGLLVLIGAIQRLRLRRDGAYRPLPEDYPGWARGLAGVVHLAFYGLMLILPLAGVLLWLFDPFVAGPGLAGQSMALIEMVGYVHAVHYFGAWLLVGLVVIHAAGALRGGWGHPGEGNVFRRMKWSSQPPESAATNRRHSRQATHRRPVRARSGVRRHVQESGRGRP